MAHVELAAPLPLSADPFARATEFLGGADTLGGQVATPFDLHDRLERGLPLAAVTALSSALLAQWSAASIAQIVGVTARTLERRRKEAGARLSADQSSRAWKFAELLARATSVLGDQAAAEDWFRRPARGLEGRVPLDLLETSAGTEAVETLLGQMEYGVYV